MSGLMVAPVEATRNLAPAEDHPIFQVEAISTVRNTMFPIESQLIQEALEAELPIEEMDDLATAQLWLRLSGLAYSLRGEDADDICDEEAPPADTRASVLSPQLGRRRIRRIP